MMRALPIAAACSMAVFGTARAEASPSYPEVVFDAVGAPCPPPCVLCHANNAGGVGTVTREFGESLLARGVGPNDDAGLRAALAELDTSHSDSNRDGYFDIDAMRAGENPNDRSDLCPVSYGCDVAHGFSAWGGLAGLGLVVVVALWRRRIAQLSVLALLLVGCANEFTDGERQRLESDGGFAGPCYAPRDVLARKCSGSLCHKAGGNKDTSLDLVSPGVENRLVDVESQVCPGRVFVSSDPAGDRYLIEKLTSDTPECGVRMPGVISGKVLPDDLLKCLEQWLDETIAPRDR